MRISKQLVLPILVMVAGFGVLASAQAMAMKVKPRRSECSSSSRRTARR